MTLSKAFGVLVVGICLSGPATAQLSGKGGPIHVSAERSEVLDRKKQVIISGNVDIVQADTALRADRVVLTYAGGGATRSGGIGGSFGDIKSMSATGNVFYLTPELKATGESGFYDAEKDVIKLDGKEVILQRGEDFATGKCLIMDLGNGRTNLYGTSCNQAETNGRVVFLIDQETAASVDE